MSGTMSGISTLPMELHLWILHYLEYLQDVNALARTNHLLFSRINPYLYSRISQDILNDITLFDPAQVQPRYTVLHRAAEKGLHDSVRRLLQAGISSGPATGTRHPIMVAAKFGHAKVVQVFLDHGVDPNLPTGFDTPINKVGNPLTEAVIHGQIPVINQLIAHGVDLWLDKKPIVNQPLWLAVKSGRIEVVKLLLDHGLSPMTPDDYPNEPETTFTAAAEQSVEMLELVLGKVENPDSVSLRQFHGLLPLAAAKKCDLALLKRLWKYVDPIEMHFPLRIMTQHEMQRLEPVANDLYGPGYRPDIFSLFSWMARYHKYSEMAHFLLDQIDVEKVLGPSCPYLRPVCCLFMGAACFGDIDLMSRILKVNLWSKSPYPDLGWQETLNSALVCSASLGHTLVTELLLDNGADILGDMIPPRPLTWQDDLATPLQKALRNGHLETVKLLLDRGARPFPRETNSLGLFCSSARWVNFSYGEDLEILKFFIERDLITRIPREREDYHILLYYAAMKGEAVFDMILQYTGITLDPKNRYHMSAMYSALCMGHTSLVKRFLQLGFDANHLRLESDRDNYRYVLSLSAVASGAANRENGEALVDLLLEYGADLNLKFGLESLTPLSILRLYVPPRHYNYAVELLLKKGADPFQTDEWGNDLLTQLALNEDPRDIEQLLKFFDESDLDLEKIKSSVRAAANASTYLRVTKLLWHWYWRKVHPCP